MVPLPADTRGDGRRTSPVREASGNADCWKLDASLDEVIEADVSAYPQRGRSVARSARSTWSKGKGRGGHSEDWGKAQVAANYWDAENGWTYRGPPSSMGSKGSSWREKSSWEEDSGSGDNWSWRSSHKGDGKGDRGGWWDSDYSSGWQKASSSSGWASTGSGWSSRSSWSSGGWQQREADDAGWNSNTTSWGGGGSAATPEPEPAASREGTSDDVIYVGTSPDRPRTRRGPASFAEAGVAPKKHRLEDDRAAPLPQSQWKRVKVSNIPPRLPKADICSAFEAATGRILSFELEPGTAYITFSDPRHAAKAADTFDQGELNGNTIEVKVIP
mmetsp:Transcript_81551/g.243123  ORF Transcript_81551/g.243123 Transcript_81551/m.243123 type:complete len:331 (-) Transcript_81551:62-1054(-)